VSARKGSQLASRIFSVFLGWTELPIVRISPFGYHNMAGMQYVHVVFGTGLCFSDFLIDDLNYDHVTIPVLAFSDSIHFPFSPIHPVATLE
jgi:hypothetical protein